ncbi:MAG TPA: LptF/LptG family permease [Bdellovibrionota bacterium]|nr:LptF/LptG family permease [Bdellovibrionota bacterium]
MRPRRIDSYLLSEVIGPFFGAVIFFLFISLMFQALRLTEFFIVHGVPGGMLFKMAGLLGLSFMPTALPVAFLVAVLVAFGRLSADGELVAMKACGIGILRLAVPVLGLATLVVLASLALNLQICPWGERTFKQMLIKVSNTKAVTSIKEGTFTSGFFDLLIFADKVDAQENKLFSVFIFDEREAKNPLTVVAREGEILPVKTGSQFGAAAMLRLYDGSIHRNDLEGNTYQKIGFGQYDLYLKIDEGGGDASPKPSAISYQDLQDRILKNGAATYAGREWRGELWRRYAVAITPLVFVFLGIGFGTVRTRAVRAGAAFTALAILLFYWILQTLGTVALQKALAPAFITMFFPVVALAVLGFFAFRRASW